MADGSTGYSFEFYVLSFLNHDEHPEGELQDADGTHQGDVFDSAVSGGDDRRTAHVPGRTLHRQPPTATVAGECRVHMHAALLKLAVAASELGRVLAHYYAYYYD